MRIYSEDTHTVVRTDALRALFDVAVNSLDFGSGFWDEEETNAAREIALALGLCPMVATPADMRRNYPKCEGTVTHYPSGEARREWTHNEH